MKFSNQTSTIFRVLLGSFVVVAFLGMQALVSAETLEIQYTGLDIVYDGSSISTSASPDPLESVDFIVCGTKMASLNAPGDSPLEISLNVPGVLNIPVAGGTVVSAAGGSLALTLPGGDIVDLALGEASITYVAMDSLNIYFLLGGGSAAVIQQLLPIEGGFEDVVAISFSTNLNSGSKTESGGYVTSFAANGTGEIQGGYIPEPGTITLLLCGMASLLCYRRKA